MTHDPSAIAAGLAGFISTLATAHRTKADAEQQETQALHKPAYVLLTARRVQKHQAYLAT